MIVTSYFANHRKLKEAGFLIYSIARYAPKGVDGLRVALAPSEDLLRDRKAGLVSDEEFTEVYLSEIENLPTCYFNKLLEEGAKANIALCCYCGKNSFCHRRVLAKFIKDKFNQEIKEF